MQAELVDLEAKENVEVRYAEGFQPLDPCESAASQLRLFSQRQGQTSPVKGNSQSNQDFANEVGELGTVHAEAGNGIEASDAPDVSKPQPLQIDLKQGQFVGRPALQLRNFRSFDGNAAGKDGAGKAERGARGESGNVTLPGSVPVTAAADGFDLVAEAAREAQPGAQLEEEQTTKNQDSANHMSELGTVHAEAGNGIEASDAPDVSKPQPLQIDLKQGQFVGRPALQLRNFRSFDGNAAGKDGAGKADRGARGESGNVTLPGSVPVTAAADGFDLVAEAAREAQPGAQLEEEQTTKNQDSANHMSELGTVHAEAGNGIEASDAPDVSKPQPLQIDLKQGQFVGRPALQLRNFRSFDGNAAGKDGAGKADRGARGESGNVTLPGSVPVTAAADGFDLVAEAAREAQPGAQLEEEQTTKNQDSANHVSELGTVHAEAGNGIEASDAPDVSKPQPLQIDLKQGQFVGRPALQLRNFRSFDGNAAGKDGAGKAERGARGESGNVTLPGSVPVTAAADGFDLVAEAAREAQPGAQLEEEQTTKNQDSANHVSELGTVHAEAGNGIEASDAPDVSKPQPLQIDLKQGQFVGRPALQLRNFRSFDGNAAGKDGAGKADRGARGESGNVTLPGSVPVTAAADGFDLVAEAAREAQPGAQLEEEQTTKNQDSANHVSELGTVHAEAGNGIEASDAPDVSKPQPLQIDLKQGQFVGCPALQLRNFRSFDGNAAGKDGAGKAERGARGESGNVTLPSSVPVTAAADGFDLVAEAAREAQPGAQLEEEQTTKNQDSANHVSGLGTVGIEASDAPDISKTVTEPSQTDLKQELSIRSPALQLQHLRSQKSVSPKFRKDPRAGRGSSESPHALAGGRRRPFSEAESRSRPSRSSRSASPERVVETKKKSDGTNGIAAQLVEDKADLGELGEPKAVQSEENCNGQLSPALNLRDLRSSMALHQQRKEELEKCVANFAQSEQFHQCIMQTEQAHALLQQLLPQGKPGQPGQPGKSEDSPKKLQQQPYLLSVALKRAGETEPAVKLDSLASDGARPSMP